MLNPTGFPQSPGPRPQTPAAQPRPHGGRRPGAGAPIGNVNAFKSGRRTRLSLAYYFFSVTPSLRQFREGLMPHSQPADRAFARAILHSCDWVLENSPQLHDAMQRLIHVHIIQGDTDDVRGGPELLAMMKRLPPDTEYHRTQYALDIAAWAHKYHPPMAADVDAYLLELISEAPDYPTQAPQPPAATP